MTQPRLCLCLLSHTTLAASDIRLLTVSLKVKDLPRTGQVPVLVTINKVISISLAPSRLLSAEKEKRGEAPAFQELPV